MSSSTSINNNVDIELTDLKLIIITVESKILNIKFDTNTLINDILQLINSETNQNEKLYEVEPQEENKVEAQEENKVEAQKDKYVLPEDIIKIGCNYGEYISDKYIELTTKVKKSNRGRKKKEKTVTKRKQQGNSKYFNSQITFTILDSINKQKFYHIKLFANGTIQIPFVCNENVASSHYLIEYIIDLLNRFDYVKIDKLDNITIDYDKTKSTMRNYNFTPVNKLLHIDLKKFHLFIENFKQYCDNNKYIDKGNKFYIESIDTSLYDKYYDELSTFSIAQNNYSVEKNSSLIIRFRTPIESKPKKLTTVMIFASGIFNLFACKDKTQALLIQTILFRLITIGKDHIFYI